MQAIGQALALFFFLSLIVLFVDDKNGVDLHDKLVMWVDQQVQPKP